MRVCRGCRARRNAPESLHDVDLDAGELQLLAALAQEPLQREHLPRVALAHEVHETVPTLAEHAHDAVAPAIHRDLGPRVEHGPEARREEGRHCVFGCPPGRPEVAPAWRDAL